MFARPATPSVGFRSRMRRRSKHGHFPSGAAGAPPGVAARWRGPYRSRASCPSTSPSPHYFKRMPSGSKPLIASHGSPAPRTAPALTDLEQRILDYMVLYLRTHTYQPSIREIGHHFGIKSTKTVSELLQSLAEKGVVERDPSRSRGIRILGLDLNAQYGVAALLPRPGGGGCRVSGAAGPNTASASTGSWPGAAAVSWCTPPVTG